MRPRPRPSRYKTVEYSVVSKELELDKVLGPGSADSGWRRIAIWALIDEKAPLKPQSFGRGSWDSATPKIHSSELAESDA
eukprot:6214717-Pleurochrysis_carterae.AAC.2